MKFHEIFRNFIKYMEIHEILRFKPSATLHETFVFLRKKQGLRSSTPQEPQKAWKSSKKQKNMNFHKIHPNLIQFQKFQGKSCFVVPGSEFERFNH